ncbi:hypothetical protein ACFOHK_10525 [Falsigemmobacter intermedius]|uniref:Uncharacterized protein n=1 Tax=Falsigemmobacter intermedius TaxID=1553448 RepID=A0A444MFY8_9RHOB|nr:hypothetical protein [Falsigemmobacter intermedius]RWY44593.1 hypothetical protein EP867_01190 [Falsigemmobacter intermedius]
MKALFAAVGVLALASGAGSVAGASPVITPGKTACDFEKIEEFVAWFGGSAENQRSATVNPLDAGFMEMEAKDGPVLVQSPHDHEELGWPILPDVAAVRMGHKMIYTEVDADQVKLQTKGGLGVDITYTFRRQPCWTLVKLEDRTRS